MSKRTERREAERAARKAAYKELVRRRSEPANIQETAAPSMQIPAEIQAVAPVPAIELPIQAAAAPAVEPTPAISQAQLVANQANAQLSTGPTSAAGKAISSKNALKHALTGQTVLLPTDDASEYEHRLTTLIDALQPATEDELRLVQTIVDSKWRITRCQTLETALLMKGQIELQALYPDQTPARRRALIDVEVYLKYEKSLRNLQLQESRLRRLVDKSQAELERLQMIRKGEERAAARAQAACARPATPSRPQPNGFDFSTGKTSPAHSPNKPASSASGSR